jgi:Type I phosphodiesterase / nucleotide pyrophosphatase
MTEPPVTSRYDRAVFLLLDGARADLFAELLAAGDLPNVSRSVIELGTGTTATTVFPSVTGVAYATYVTGCFPGATNLPGVCWLDRQQYARKKMSLSRFRNYVGAGHYMMDRDLSPEVTTLFELLRPSRNIFGTVSRGTGIRGNAFLVRRVPYALGFLATGDWRPIDARSHALLLRGLERRRDRFTFHTTLQIDEHSHMDGPFSPRARQGYYTFDRTVGALAQRLKRAGRLERTLLCVCSDHGHREVTDHFDLAGFFEARGLRTMSYPKAFQHWFRCEAAVMVGGNSMGHVYLRGSGWGADEPSESRLDRVKGVVEDLLGEPAVDIVAWPGVSGVEVRSRRGRATVVRDGDGLSWTVHGSDPFGYDELPVRMSSLEVLGLTQDSDYPDGPTQVSQIFGSARAGDLVVSAAPGWDLTARQRHAHRSGHGSLHKDHMRVPFAMSYPFPAGPVRTVDAFPTILELLGEDSPSGIDGRSLV